jgi:hypothetical protein
MVPLALAQGRLAGVLGSPVTQTDTSPSRCFLRNGPSHPLELNTQEVGDRFKSIAMEKEVFSCNDNAQAVDVETFIEVVERVKDGDDDDHAADQVVQESRRIETATCIKDFISGYVACSNQKSIPTTTTNAADLFGGDCGPSESQPDDPVEMTSEETDGVVKTIKVEKEVLTNCYPPEGGGGAGAQGTLLASGVADLYLFTEIIEAQKGGTIKPVQRRFDGVICYKNTTGGESDADPPGIISCQTFRPLNAPPTPD